MEKKKFKLLLAIIYCIINILAIAVIPLNLFVLYFSEWVCMVFAGSVLLGIIYLWRSHKGKYTKKTIVTCISLVVILVTLFGSFCNPYWNSISLRSNVNYNSKDYNYILTYKQAKADLDYAMHYLKKLHPALYNVVPSDIKARYEMAVENLQAMEEITINRFAQEVEGIFSLLKDAHTSVSTNFGDARYMKYTYKHNVAGDRVVMINGTSLEDLLAANASKMSFETEDWGLIRLKNHIVSIEGLDYLDISVDEGVIYTYETETGELIEQHASKEDFLTYDEYLVYNEIDNSNESASNFVYYDIDVEHNVAVLTLTSCILNEEYMSCLKDMFTEVKEQGITNVAVDLRGNNGGHSGVANEFFRYMNIDSYKEWASKWRLGCFFINFEQSIIENIKCEDLLFEGDLYLITAANSFSSAMDFAEYVKDNEMGLIIGEASGNDPNSYGDISSFKLPQSQLYMQISTKKWYRIDYKEGLIEPDIPCASDEAMTLLYKTID